MNVNRLGYGVPDDVWPPLLPDGLLKAHQVKALTFALGEVLNGHGFTKSFAVDFIGSVIEEVFDEYFHRAEFFQAIDVMHASMRVMGLDPDEGKDEPDDGGNEPEQVEGPGDEVVF